MKVVYDTNIYVSGLFWGGSPGDLLKRAAKGEVQLVISGFILDEISKVLSESFGVPEDVVTSIIDTFEAISVKVYPKYHVNVVRDKKDNGVLECALEGKCDYIVTGDKDLLILKEHHGIKITTPKKFLQILNP